MSPTPSVPATGELSEWQRLIEEVLAHPARIKMALQPIVDLDRARIVGYEALARFEGPPDLAPDFWFAAAHDLGVGAELESLAVEAAMLKAAAVPAGRFVSINVSPTGLASPRVLEAFAKAAVLSSVVVEITERSVIDDEDALEHALNQLRAGGVRLASDHAGAPHTDLKRLVNLKPNLVKLDRTLVTDIEREETELLVEALAQVSRRIGATIVAEGIEQSDELDHMVRLDVPLGQGYLLGRPLLETT